MTNSGTNGRGLWRFAAGGFVIGALMVGFLATAAQGQTPSAKPPAPANPAAAPDSAGLYNAALLDLGATAKGSGSHFNSDWPPNNTLAAGSNAGSGTLFGPPLKGGRVDVRLVIPVEIKAFEVLGLDYNGTALPSGVDVYVEGKMVKHAELPETGGKITRIELDEPIRGQNVGFVVTGDYPIRTLADGTKGPPWGGLARLRVLTTTNVAGQMKDVDEYQVSAAAANIAPTAGATAGEKPEVVGQPRDTKGHPCTLWDAEDIAHFKEMLKTSKELQIQYAGLKRAMDERITQPPGIPQPRRGADGKWEHISDIEKLGESTVGGVHNQIGLDIANLGAMYALSGEAKYAEFAKKLLLAYADVHAEYGIGARPGFNHDPSRVFDQRLGDSTWGIQVARGYDLIHDLPSITLEERKHIEDDLIKAVARDIIGNHAMMEAETNWSAIATCAVLMCGYASDDEGIINTAYWGMNGTKEKPTGGLFKCHFGPGAIDVDGMWAEGAMGYQFMALQALIMDAEALWHHGMDMYRYRDCALKRLFDSPLREAYPDLTTPALHDSGHDSIICPDSYLYEFAYRRYRDPSYLLVLNQSGTHLDAQFQKFPVSVLYDRDLKEKTAPVEWKSVNFFGVGYGIERLTTPAGTSSMLLEYGPNRSHGHPDKLCVDYYAFNDQLMIDPGSIWYEQPLYRQWYHTTFAHNTLTVDELDQKMCGATQLVYGPADTFAIQRASCNEAYAGVIMDRSLFLTPNYMADVFGAFARLPRKMDLVWHIRGEFASDLKMEPMTFPKPVENGYCALTNVRHAALGSTGVSPVPGFTATISRKGNVARFLSAGGTPTDVIVADGLYEIEKPPTIIERRNVASTVYGNVTDVSNAKDGYVKEVTIEGGLEKGYALMKIKTAVGEDLCFASYSPGANKIGGFCTDAEQAMVVTDGGKVRAMYLGGGKLLFSGENSLNRSEPGLAFIEKAETGSYIVGNPSPTEANLTLVFGELKGMEAFVLDSVGRRVGPAQLSKDETYCCLIIKPASKVEFAPKGAQSVYDYRQAMLAKRQADQEAAMAKARDEALARDKVRQAEAKANPVPAGTVVAVRAVDFTGEGDGNVEIVATKRASIGKSIIHWDAQGQWVEWTFDAPKEGYYNLTLCYCSEMDKIEREIKVNGVVQEPFAPMVLPSTGGYANGSDDWRLFTAVGPTGDQPLLIKFKQGKNVVRLTNMNGRASNVDWLAVTSPDVKIDRQAIAEKLK